jgi:endonuclease YncB( thermonuclease family)
MEANIRAKNPRPSNGLFVATAAATFIALAAAFFGPASADSPLSPSEPPLRRVISVYDGDTLRTREEGSVRLLGMDTPEIRGACPREIEMARAARDHVHERTRGGVRLLDRVRDDHGRLQASVDRYGRKLRLGIAADGGDLRHELIAMGLAVPYWGRGVRKDWCKPE